MDAVKFLKEQERLCASFPFEIEIQCKGCPLLGEHLECKMNTPKAVAIVEKWSKEHPRKTRLDDFESKYPGAKYVCGIPSFCCSDLGYCDCKDICTADCEKCWNTPLEDYE